MRYWSLRFLLVRLQLLVADGKLKENAFITVGIGILVSFTGYWLAYWLNASIAGCMALMTGIVFAVVFVYTQFVVKYKKRKLVENELSQLQESNV